MPSNNKLPKISIITIVYNGIDTLDKTIKSIVNQEYKNIEYIIIDGNSTDGTQNLIASYGDKISKWISEPDSGLYDAMNKGIKLATGDYLWFINSGDLIPEPTTLSAIFDSSITLDGDIYYGDTMMIDIDCNIIGERRLSPPEQLTWKSFKNGMVVSHQSFIAKRSLAPLYNTKYRFSADFEWCLTILKRSHKIINTNLVLSHFLDGGISKKNIVPGLKERFRIMVHFFGLISTLLYHLPIAIRFFSFWIKNRRF